MTTLAALPRGAHARLPWPDRRSWVRACVAAEGLGISAAAAASVIAASTSAGVGARLGIVVAGGLVEGLALGLFQARALGPDASSGQRRRWLFVTILVAGVGWGAGSLPSEVQVGPVRQPALVVVLLGAAALGAAMGLLMGAVQAPVLRGLVRRPWRWAVVSAVSWAPAMVVIFLGATLPSSTWPPVVILLMGPPTGVLAGLVLGVVSVRVADSVGLDAERPVANQLD